MTEFALPSEIEPLVVPEALPVVASPVDDPVAVAAAEEDSVAVLVAAVALSESAAVVLDPDVAEPVVEVVAVFSIALLLDPEVMTGKAAESGILEVPDPAVLETVLVVTAELVAPSETVVAAAVSELAV